MIKAVIYRPGENFPNGLQGLQCIKKGRLAPKIFVFVGEAMVT